MGFSERQLQALKRDLAGRHVRTRTVSGRELCYVEGSHAIAEANRIFGFDGWDRETIETRCILTREARGSYFAVYAAKVRITVRAKRVRIVREGHGCGEARGTASGEIHDLALKAAETDATKRALVTFGKPFGLALYSARKPTAANGATAPQASASAPAPHTDGQPAAAEQHLAEPNTLEPKPPGRSSPIDKSVLTFGAPRRHRDKEHLRFVASQPCLLCGRTPSDPHHLRFAEPRALGLKVSDEFTVPLCRTHHRQLHQAGKEAAWWEDLGINPLEIAKTLWQESRTKHALTGEKSGDEVRGRAGANDERQALSLGSLLPGAEAEHAPPKSDSKSSIGR